MVASVPSTPEAEEPGSVGSDGHEPGTDEASEDAHEAEARERSRALGLAEGWDLDAAEEMPDPWHGLVIQADNVKIIQALFDMSVVRYHGPVKGYACVHDYVTVRHESIVAHFAANHANDYRSAVALSFIEGD